VRAAKPDGLWHVDMTVIRLLDGTKVYLHAVIDNFSRRILAWRVTENFSVATTVAALQEADLGAARRDELPRRGCETGAGELKFLAGQSEPFSGATTGQGVYWPARPRGVCARRRRPCVSSTRTRNSRMFVEIARVLLRVAHAGAGA
jgi:transposase InsO family protein